MQACKGCTAEREGSRHGGHRPEPLQHNACLHALAAVLVGPALTYNYHQQRQCEVCQRQGGGLGAAMAPDTRHRLPPLEGRWGAGRPVRITVWCFAFSVGRCTGPEGVYAAARLASRRCRRFAGSLAAQIDRAILRDVRKAPQLCSPSAPERIVSTCSLRSLYEV